MESISKLFILAFLFAGCGISFETLTLEDPAEVQSNEDSFRFFKARSVFSDDATNVWGLEEDECKNFETVKIDGRGNVLKLNWNKTVCDWVGFGIGWNAWQPKDLGQIMETGEIVMDIRAVENETNIPIIVFLLEDYGGIMSAGISGGYCLEKYPITEEWQEFRMPLSVFDYKECGIDLTNVKQLVMECQSSGSILIDNIRIEEFENRVIEGKKQFEPYTITQSEYAMIFDGEFDKVWGLGKRDTRDYKVDGKVLKLKWSQPENEYLHQMATSWAGWKNIDLSENIESLYLKMDISGRSTMNGNLAIIFDHYMGEYHTLFLNDYTSDSDPQDHTIFIPLSEFSRKADFWKRIKQLRFETKGEGSVNIHRIEIVNDGA